MRSAAWGQRPGSAQRLNHSRNLSLFSPPLGGSRPPQSPAQKHFRQLHRHPGVSHSPCSKPFCLGALPAQGRVRECPLISATLSGQEEGSGPGALCLWLQNVLRLEDYMADLYFCSFNSVSLKDLLYIPSLLDGGCPGTHPGRPRQRALYARH